MRRRKNNAWSHSKDPFPVRCENKASPHYGAGSDADTALTWTKPNLRSVIRKDLPYLRFEYTNHMGTGRPASGRLKQEIACRTLFYRTAKGLVPPRVIDQRPGKSPPRWTQRAKPMGEYSANEAGRTLSPVSGRRERLERPKPRNSAISWLVRRHGIPAGIWILAG